MKLLLFLLVILGIEIQTSGQRLDYEMVSDSITQLSCGPVDSLTVEKTRIALETFDTNVISSNIHLYYHDLGWCYYRMYLITRDTSFIRRASHTYDKALSHNPSYSAVLWDKSFFSYFFYEDCLKGKYYMDRYKKVTRKKYWNKDQMSRFSYKCDH